MGTARYWGEDGEAQCRHANGADEAFKTLKRGRYARRDASVASCDDEHARTSPVGSFTPNRFSVYDVLGNVWEWTQDCWNGRYEGAPDDGRAWERGECEKRVIRGGSWMFGPDALRSAVRAGPMRGTRSVDVGFRVARPLQAEILRDVGAD